MAAAAHKPGGFGGVPHSVGREFNQADKGKKMLVKALRKPASMNPVDQVSKDDG